MRLWWNRWLVRFGRTDPEWYRTTYDENTGWHCNYRLLTAGYHVQLTTEHKWILTRRWYDPNPSLILDSAVDFRGTTASGPRDGMSAHWRRSLSDAEIQRAHEEFIGPWTFKSGWRQDVDADKD